MSLYTTPLCACGERRINGGRDACSRCRSKALHTHDHQRAAEQRRRWVAALILRGYPRQELAGALGVSRQRIEQLFRYERHQARTALWRAVRDGRVIKPDACERCLLNHRELEGHHDDYSQPLQVEWLCGGCHVITHPRYPEALRRTCSDCSTSLPARSQSKFCERCKELRKLRQAAAVWLAFPCRICGDDVKIRRSALESLRRNPRYADDYVPRQHKACVMAATCLVCGESFPTRDPVQRWHIRRRGNGALCGSEACKRTFYRTILPERRRQAIAARGGRKSRVAA